MVVDKEYPELSLRQRCELLELNRSSYYYEPQPEDEYNRLLMNLIDELYTRHPFYGGPRIWACLRRMGHEIFPYLLSGVKIVRPNQVWSVDITYIRMAYGFLYLVAIIDWYSCYVLAWDLSNTMDVAFCLEALSRALRLGNPEIFNSDQGSQFTCNDFTSILLAQNIPISMDGRGRALDNIFVERLWRSVKYENVYLNHYETAPAARAGLNGYFNFYNNERPHQSLDYQTPSEVYFSRKEVNKQEKQATGVPVAAFCGIT